MKAGWCVKCQLRIGRKRFRQLFDGMCEDCSRKYRPSGTPQPATGAASSEQKTETEQLGRSRGAGCAKIQKPKPIVSLGRTESRRDERLKQEENSLLEAFDRIKQQGITKNWHREVANLLGWKKEKVTHVAKRLRKKGLGDRIKVQNLEEQILEKLRQSTEPISAYQIAQEYLSINAPWISIKLGKLVKLGLVRVIERKLQPYLYELMEESNENSNS